MQKVLLIIMLLGFFVGCTKNKYETPPSPACDLSQSKYNPDIAKIIETNCNYSPCHSSTPMDSSLTYSFTTYAGVKRAAGSIYDRINRPVSDPLHMPKSIFKNEPGPKMDSCDLAKLNVWILSGAADN
jgi:hypothetical protein